MTHTIKLNIHFCDAVLSGEKNFEIRRNDRGYQKGDYVKFIPVENIRELRHPVEQNVYRITYVINGYGLENGFVVFGIIPDEYYLQRTTTNPQK